MRADAGGGGGIEAGATVNQGAMQATVLEVLSDHAVVCQLVAAVSNASSTSSASAPAHDGKTKFQSIALSTLKHNIYVSGTSHLTNFQLLYSPPAGASPLGEMPLAGKIASLDL